jgi:hypothetical protein
MAYVIITAVGALVACEFQWLLYFPFYFFLAVENCISGATLMSKKSAHAWFLGSWVSLCVIPAFLIYAGIMTMIGSVDMEERETGRETGTGTGIAIA